MSVAFLRGGGGRGLPTRNVATFFVEKSIRDASLKQRQPQAIVYHGADYLFNSIQLNYQTTSVLDYIGRKKAGPWIVIPASRDRLQSQSGSIALLHEEGNANEVFVLRPTTTCRKMFHEKTSHNSYRAPYYSSSLSPQVFVEKCCCPQYFRCAFANSQNGYM